MSFETIKRLPETGYVRLHQIIGNPKADPPVPPIIPVSKSTWWNGVKEGRFPQSVKLGPRTTVWRVDDIRMLIDSTYYAQAAYEETMKIIVKTIIEILEDNELDLLVLPGDFAPDLSTLPEDMELEWFESIEYMIQTS